MPVRWPRAAWLVGVAAAVTAAAAPSARADSAPWLAPEWAARRVVDVTAERAEAPGGDVAVFAFYTGGLGKPDASDVRVAVRGRKPVNHRVLQAGPGDFVRVAFEVVPAEKRYYVYWGNPNAAAPGPWEFQRGLLLEARRHDGGDPKTLAEVEAAWAKAAPLGADFVSQISFGHDPFESDDVPAVFHFVGWFVPPQPGTYSIATSSRGGSWVLVDGQEVVSWPGSHGAASDASHAKEVALTQAPHRLDYWNTHVPGHTMMVAAWRLPGAKDYEPIPAKAFLTVTEAAFVETDQRSDKVVADFFPSHAGESWWPERYAVRLQFRNLTKGTSLARGGRFEWDFGDGQTSLEANPAHVYLAPGDYAVGLTAGRGPQAAVFRTKVRVDRDWTKQASREIEPIRKYADEVAKYDLAKLDTRSLLLALDLFTHQGMPEAVVAASGELALARAGLDDETIQRSALVLGETLRRLGKAADAVAGYQKAEQRLRADRAKAPVAARIGETLAGDLHRWDDAEKECQRVLKAYATAGADEAVRRAHIGLGDVWRHRGEGDKARAAYAAAAAIVVSPMAPSQAAVRVGTLARYVEEYTRERDWEWAFKFLDDWAWEFPLDKLQGHWSWLRAQALLAHDQRDEAFLEAMDLLAGNPASAYAVRLLMFAAECQVAAGQTEKARLLLQTAVEDYPEDPQREAARLRLQALGGPVEKAAPRPAVPPAGGAAGAKSS